MFTYICKLYSFNLSLKYIDWLIDWLIKATILDAMAIVGSIQI